MPLTVTDTSHQSPAKLGSDLAAKDVVGIANRRLVVVNFGTLALVDLATCQSESLQPTVIYPTYNAVAAISDIVEA